MISEVNNQVSGKKDKQTVLLIHQSACMYGSDKTLLDLAIALKNSLNWTPIVVLPTSGPLKTKLQDCNIKVIELPVLKVSRSLLSPKNLWKLPFTIQKEVKKFKSEFSSQNIAIIHSNTLAVLMGMFTYKALKAKHVWHVHEIIEKPSFVKQFYRFILPLKSDLIISNSKATQKFWLNGREQYKTKFKLAINGVEQPAMVSQPEVDEVRSRIFHVPSNAIVIGLIGRINNHKGHHLLLDAFGKIAEKHKNIHLVMVGSPPPNQEFFKTQLVNKIEQTNFKNRCHLIDFQNDIHKIWSSVDIAVVPTTLPEPFGLVAVEAMLNKKPVIASDCGGLTEIVKHNETGYLFETNNAEDLSIKLEGLILDESLRLKMGEKGYKRAVREFSLKKHTDTILSMYDELIQD